MVVVQKRARRGGKVAWEGSNRRGRLPGNWNSLKAQAKRRANYRCQWVVDGIRCTNTTSLEVDHIVAGDNHALSNLQVLCTTHHTRKTQAELRAIRSKTKRKPEAHPGIG